MDSLLNWVVGNTLSKKIALGSVAIGSYLALDYFFDFFLYYLAIRFFGPLVGGGSIMIIGMTIDYLMLRAYDRHTKDVFGIEEIKQLRDYTGESKFRIFISKILKKGNLLALAVIAFYSNPCLATIYMRPHGHKRRTMNVNDWLVFLFCGCIEILWIALVYGVVLIETKITNLLFF